MKIGSRSRTINKSCDVLVIGAGMAASMVALEARRSGLSVVMVDKGKPGVSGTSPRCGGGGSNELPSKLGGICWPRLGTTGPLSSPQQAGGYPAEFFMSMKTLPVPRDKYGVKPPQRPT